MRLLRGESMMSEPLPNEEPITDPMPPEMMPTAAVNNIVNKCTHQYSPREARP